MKLDVPFSPLPYDLSCGPNALRMVFSYFGKDFDFETVEQASGAIRGKPTKTLRLAIGAAKLGFRSEMFWNYGGELRDLGYYQKFPTEYEEHLDKESESLGIRVSEKAFSLDELLAYVTQDSVPIVLLNLNTLYDTGDFLGHFVPIVGYDKGVLIHNSQPEEVDRDLFDKARKSRGTSENLIVVYRP